MRTKKILLAQPTHEVLNEFNGGASIIFVRAQTLIANGFPYKIASRPEFA